MRDMLEPGDPTEDAKAGRADDAQPGIPRLIGAAFKRERKRTERLFNELVATVSAEIGRIFARAPRRRTCTPRRALRISLAISGKESETFFKNSRLSILNGVLY